ncbi:DUF948 domain-containing protein [Intestinibacter bartlettii]|uniref:DUF948 domain-containing protein n=1 Tax=Intestinibacter bartlettii TaxID=261299 RepID=A0ABS6DUA2_9FIRM|nr:DUF948 domain-containing protein [Intestinibacter bartlettii]MBU5335400.1 DUF948 domain-containing protein [Intestinibacter bartlettii]
MNAIGWQIGAVLFGVAILIIAIYIAKTLNSATKTIDRVNKIIDYNEKNLNQIIDNAADITNKVRSILDVVEKVTGFFKVLRVFKK